MNLAFCLPRGACWRTALLVAALAMAAATARAELQVVEESDEGHLTIYKMTVTPAAEPDPALKHRLTPEEMDLKPGNAALFYTRAFAEGYVRSAWKGIEKEHGFDVVHGGEKSSSWISTTLPLNELPLEAARSAASKFDTIVEQFVARGTVRRDCDWGHHLEELRGENVFSLLLPEIQESRSLSRALMLRTRVAIAEGDYQRAIDHLRMNYRLAEHVAEAPFLVSGLVGVAEAGLGNAEVIELISQKSSPNLYWALAELPRPFIDLRTAVRFEMGNALRIFPFLLNAESQEHSPDEWARLIAEGVSQFGQFSDGGPPSSASRTANQAAVTGLAIIIYPDAKQRLIASGMDAARVEQLPVGQVVAIDASREYRRLADEFEKWWYVPYRVAKGRAAEADKLLSEGSRGAGRFRGGMGRSMAALLLPAMEAARNAQMRLEWQLDSLMAVEAIRMHAAETGALPATLEEITVVPTPENPATGEPFEYRLDGETAVLELPFSDGFAGVAWRYEITLASE